MSDIYEEDIVGMVSERMKHEEALFLVAERQFESTSAKKKTFPRGYERLKTRSILRNVRKGLKIIRAKNPLYIEMPTLKKVGNGQVKKVYDNRFKDKPDNDEIVCYSSLSEQNVSGLIEE